MGSNGWHRVCGDCWYDVNPNEYLPDESVSAGICEVCEYGGELLYATRFPPPPVCGIGPNSGYHDPDPGPDGLCRLPGCGRPRITHLRS